MRMIVKGLVQVGNNKGVWRAGRMWPQDGVVVEVVVGSDEDPAPAEDGTLRIGKKTWEALKADTRLIHITPDGPVEDIAALKAANDALTTENAALKAANDALTTENAALKARVAELEAAAAPKKTGK